VGKSSLLNALAGQEVAIVTPIAGTTRDRIEQVLQIDGVPLHVIDTAGLRSEDAASDDVERIGIARSWEAIRQADAVLLLADGSRIGQDDYDAADAQIRQQLQAHGVPQDRWLLATNKADLDTGSALKTHADIGDSDASGTGLRLSAKTGEGLEALRRALLHRAGWQDLPEGVALARTRHVEALRRCAQHLERAHEEAQAATPAIDLFAEELRLAHHALGEITGQVSADELLGVIFSSFCIGK
jgi:tRNA modification GTPase